MRYEDMCWMNIHRYLVFRFDFLWIMDAPIHSTKPNTLMELLNILDRPAKLVLAGNPKLQMEVVSALGPPQHLWTAWIHLVVPREPELSEVLKRINDLPETMQGSEALAATPNYSFNAFLNLLRAVGVTDIPDRYEIAGYCDEQVPTPDITNQLEDLKIGN